MKLSRVIGLCVATLVSAWNFAGSGLQAEQVLQFPDGFVWFRGAYESEAVTLVGRPNGGIQLVYNDLTNDESRVYDFSNVNGLALDLKGGENFVHFHGLVVINGNFTVKSDGDCEFRSESAATDSLFVNGNFNFHTEDGSDEFLCSNEHDVINVTGNMSVLTGDYGIDDIRIGNCLVAGKCEIRTGAGFDKVYLGINQSGSSQSITGISTGGSLTIHTGIAGYQDFVICDECTVMGNLSIVTGVGDDQVTLRDSNIYGQTTINTGRDGDIVRVLGSTLNDALNVNSGSGHDVVGIDFSDLYAGGYVQLKNGDDQLTLTNSSFAFGTSFTANAGNGYDTAFRANCTFPKGFFALHFEQRNF